MYFHYLGLTGKTSISCPSLMSLVVGGNKLVHRASGEGAVSVLLEREFVDWDPVTMEGWWYVFNFGWCITWWWSKSCPFSIFPYDTARGCLVHQVCAGARWNITVPDFHVTYSPNIPWILSPTLHSIKHNLSIFPCICCPCPLCWQRLCIKELLDGMQIKQDALSWIVLSSSLLELFSPQQVESISSWCRKELPVLV